MSYFFPFGFYSPKHSNRCYGSSHETCSVFCSTSVLPAWAFSLQTPGAFSVSPSVLGQTRRFGWPRRTPVAPLSLSLSLTQSHTDTRNLMGDLYHVHGASPKPVPELKSEPRPKRVSCLCRGRSEGAHPQSAHAQAPCRVGGVVAGRRKRVRTSSRQSPPRNSLRRWSRHCPSG
jgi:hypothetical protein